MITKRSPYLYRSTKESFFRRLIRGLYTTYLDELYIPEGTTISSSHPYAHTYTYVIRTPRSNIRKGMMEAYLG